MIKVACAGFPVGRKNYEAKLRTVELTDLFDAFPKLDTVRKWKAAAPDHFDFIVCASKRITHPFKSRAQSSKKPIVASSPFDSSANVRLAYQQTLQVAETLKSRLVFFQLAPNFGPTADNVQRFQSFFGNARRGHTIFIWEPPATWPDKLVDTLTEKYRIYPVMNPLGKIKPRPDAAMRYYRLGAHGRTSGVGALSDAELKKVKAYCDSPLCYVVFNNGPTAFKDAERFSLL